MTPTKSTMRARTRKLRLARGFIEMQAAEVSLSFFTWSKPPGNHYLTFYPTAMIPPPEEIASLRDPEVGRRIRRAVVNLTHPRSLTMGTYSRDNDPVSLPAWSVKHRGGVQIYPVEASLATDYELARPLTTDLDCPELHALKLMASCMDVDWLRSAGHADAAETRRVLTWIDRLVERLSKSEEAAMVMRFAESKPAPFLLWVAEIRAAGPMGSEVWWPDRNRSSWR